LRFIAKGVHYARSAEELVMVYADAVTEEECRRFIEREKLSAGAAVPLWFGDDVVAIIFVNYRRDHNFSKYERSIIETLARPRRLQFSTAGSFGGVSRRCWR
jgi:GAF domain-containing protein